MAWEDFEINGVSGFTGDKPLDELAIALDKVAAAYQDRFNRKPLMMEIVRALETVVGSRPERYVCDTEGLRLMSITVQRDLENERKYIDVTQYEAVYIELNNAGYYAILYKSAGDKKVEAIKIPVLEIHEKVLGCEYEILQGGLTDEMVGHLVLTVLLRNYMDNFYRDQADEISLKNLQSGHAWNITYN